MLSETSETGLMDDPTPEEIQRVRDYHKRQSEQREGQRRAEREEAQRKQLLALADMFVGRTIKRVYVDTKDTRLPDPDLNEIRLTFDNGQRVTFEPLKWSDEWGVEMFWDEDPDA